MLKLEKLNGRLVTGLIIIATLLGSLFLDGKYAIHAILATFTILALCNALYVLIDWLRN